MRILVVILFLFLTCPASVSHAQAVLAEEIGELNSSPQMELVIQQKYGREIENFVPEDLEVNLGDAKSLKIEVHPGFVQATVFWPYVVTYNGEPVKCLGLFKTVPSGVVCYIYQQLRLEVEEPDSPVEKAELPSGTTT